MARIQTMRVDRMLSSMGYGSRSEVTRMGKAGIITLDAAEIINDLLGIKDRYPETQRAQLNLLAPVPVVLRWRQLVAGANGRPAWEVLEQAMDALEAAQGPANTGGRS
ncbi:MAG: hypothetical protein B7Z12_22160 [Caulobacter vibrioides]|uniref:Uncharacterized protein n=1 Tax=Caulobacter vibrioides TaxID=155892 RepID=A0A258CNL9_CAUVI|nr:MAG: hypothetical protein B7Z12_22160 [Caulobacter vibrioides]